MYPAYHIPLLYWGREVKYYAQELISPAPYREVPLYAWLMSNLPAGMHLIGVYKEANKLEPEVFWLYDFLVFNHYEDRVQKGELERLGHYAVLRDILTYVRH